MNINSTDPLYLAHVFAGKLRDTLQGNDIYIVIARNESEPNSAICHSHDFCDANQCMIDALEIIGWPYVGDDDAQNAVMTDAWGIAVEHCFWIGY